MKPQDIFGTSYVGSFCEPTALAAGAARTVPITFDRTPEEPPKADWSGSSRAHFESADTDRLNEAHWSVVDDSLINDILGYRLQTMRARSCHEYWNNPTIKGLVLSHTIAVVGEDSPLIDLQGQNSAEDRWCEEAEQLWENWCSNSDAAGRLSLSARIKKWNRTCWTNGEWLDQLVYPRDASGPVKLRLHELETQRLLTPSDVGIDPKVVLGIRRDEYRKPVEYYISNDLFGWTGGQWIKAGNILHGWDESMAEAGQARGVPWLQIGLPTAADLRDYDVQVMDAARSAADMALVAFTRHPDAEFFKDVPQTVSFRRRRINNLAPGWEPASFPASHPTAQYKEHRQERQGDLGRAEGVPSMVTRLDARDHNYSSARFDYGMLHESAKHVRSTIYNPKLFVLASLVLREAQLAGALPPAPPRILTNFVWTAMPQIDEAKSADAEEKYLKIGTLSYSTAVIERHGRRVSDVVRARARDARLLEANNLPSVAEATSKTPTQTQTTA